MKKSVIILITLIFIAAIALVVFLGTNPKDYVTIVYVEDIEITNKDILVDGAGNKYVIIELDENMCAEYDIECEITPDVDDRDSIFANLRMSYDQKEGVTIDEENGVVYFDLSETSLRNQTIVVKLIPNDGSDCEDSVKIIAVKKS